MIKKIISAAFALAMMAGLGIGMAGPAAAANPPNNGTWSLVNTTAGGGSLGTSTLSGTVYNVGNGGSLVTAPYPSSGSMRAFKTAPGYCIVESSKFYDADGVYRTGPQYTHHYTTANGGFSRINATYLQSQTIYITATIVGC